MHVLVTRPLEDATRTAQRLATRGHRALIAPLLEVRSFDGTELALDDVQAILATSGNGIRALARRSPRRDIAVFAVGTRTAAVACAEGFARVLDAEGDAEALAALVQRRLQPHAGSLLHATGADSQDDLHALLERSGFRVRSCVLYEAHPVPFLGSAACEALRDGSLDAVLIFSPRSARLLVERVREAGLADSCGRLIACCISQAAALMLQDLDVGAIRVAERPDQDSLIALLDRPLPAMLQDPAKT